MKKLLIERTSVIEVPKQTLIESIHKNDGRLIIKNVLVQRADAPNKNGRVYPKRVLERSIEEYMSLVRSKMAYGEIDHPNEPEANVISMKNVAQAIQDVRWKGNEVYADVEILKTPAGNIIKEILLAGYKVGQSSRGMGSVEPLNEADGQDLVEVQDDFSLLTISDIVSNPSTFYAEMALSENYIGSNKIIIPDPEPTKVDRLIQDILCEISNLCCIHKK